MLALYRSGRQADALDVFQEARRVLMDELALEPGPELRRLQEAILAHDPAIAPVPLAPRARGNVPAPSTPFIDREAELGQESSGAPPVTLTGPSASARVDSPEAARSPLESEPRGGAWHVGLANAAARPTSSASSRRPSTPAAPIRWRGSWRAFVTPTRSSSSTPASTSSRRPRVSSKRF